MRKSYVPVLALGFILISVFLNDNSLHKVEQSCIANGKTPNVEKTLLAVNWSFSCR